MSPKDKNIKNTGNLRKSKESGNDVNPVNTDQDMEVSEIGKPVIDKKIPKNVPGVDTGRWAD